MLYNYISDRPYSHKTSINVVADHDVHFSASFAQFYCPVRFSDCTIKHFDLYATYFLGGLEIERCEILCPVNWQSGGHNSQPIRIVNSTFREFLDVEDCSFEQSVLLRDVKFLKGTNFLGNVGTPVEVGFETPLIHERVEGRIDLDTFHSHGV